MCKAFKVIKKMMKNHIWFAFFDEASAADGSCPREQIADAFCIAMGRWHCAEDYAGSSPRADVTSENLLRQLAGQEQAGQRLWPCRTPMALWKAVHQLGWQCNIPGSSLAEMVRAWTSLRDQTVNGNM